MSLLDLQGLTTDHQGGEPGGGVGGGVGGGSNLSLLLCYNDSPSNLSVALCL